MILHRRLRARPRRSCGNWRLTIFGVIRSIGTKSATSGSRNSWRFGGFAPNLDESNILSTDSTTPLDIERHDRNMYCGDWMVGEYSGDQALENRPFPGWGNYRTPIDGLFLCGSSCHPGGNITGAPGYNAARVIAESLGIKPWWKPLTLKSI